MTCKLIYTTFLLLLVTLTAWGQSQKNISDIFFEFLNSYQKDSLQNILTDDFQLNRTYTTYSNDKSSFLDKYLRNSKAFNGKYKILKVISENEPKQFLVEDQSDYLKYLNVDYPTWKITIFTKNNKINMVTIDTTETYEKYSANIKIADEIFMNWLKSNYPNVSQEMLYNEEGLLAKRLKEHAEMRK
jgi:hypothetical protein